MWLVDDMARVAELNYHTLLQHGWIKAVDFQEKYNLSRTTVAVYRNQKSTNYTQFYLGDLWVHEKRLQQLRDFYDRVWQEAVENYFILTEYGSDWKLATLITLYLSGNKNKKEVASWNEYFHKYFFTTTFRDATLLNYTFKPRLYIFWRLSRWFVRWLEKREKAIYKRLPNRDRYEEIYKQRGCSR